MADAKMPRVAKVAIVTGASSGMGKGCALNLANADGYTVYATARTASDLEALAKEVTGSGKIVPCVLDQSKDEDVKAFVQRVEAEQGKVDVLVNSAFAGLGAIKPYFGKPFWEKPIEVYDASLNIGTRSAYVMSTYVAPMMVKANAGLMVQISSGGGMGYLFDVGYGVGKAALDRLSADMAVELKPHGVYSLTLWPGGATTEKAAFPGGETPVFVGRALSALAKAPAEDLAKFNGKMVLTSELATKYGFVDADGKLPVGMFSGVEWATGVRKALDDGPVLQYNLKGELPDWSASNCEPAAGFLPGY